MTKPTDLDTLKAWCHWKKREVDVAEDDLLMVKAIEDVISQAGMVPALREQLAAAKIEVTVLKTKIAWYEHDAPPEEQTEIP